MRGQAGFFDVDERLRELSAKGDALERLNGIIDFELFRPDLEKAVPRSDGSKGGRPPFDLVFMWKVLILQASHSLSDERTEFPIKDRLPDPDLDGNGRRPSQRGAVAGPYLEGEHGKRRVGRHRLPLEGQREAPRRQWLALADPPQEAPGPPYAGEHRPRQRRQVEGALRG